MTAIEPFQLHRSTAHPVSGGPRSIPTLLHRLKSAIAEAVSLGLRTVCGIIAHRQAEAAPSNTG